MITIFCQFLLVLCFFAICFGQKNDSSSKAPDMCDVWRKSENANYSYVVEISVEQGYYFCPGILVEANWVLMSYSCFQRISDFAADKSRTSVQSIDPPVLQNFFQDTDCFDIQNLKNTQIQIRSVAGNCVNGTSDREYGLYTIPQFGVVYDKFFSENVEIFDENAGNYENVTAHVNDFMLLKLQGGFPDVPLDLVTLSPFDFENQQIFGYEIFLFAQIEKNFHRIFAWAEVLGASQNNDFQCQNQNSFQNAICEQNETFCTDQVYICGKFEMPYLSQYSFQLQSGAPLVRKQDSMDAEIFGFFTTDFVPQSYIKYYDQLSISRTIYTYGPGNYSFDSNGAIFVGFTQEILSWISNTTKLYQQNICTPILSAQNSNSSINNQINTGTDNVRVTVVIVLCIVIGFFVAVGIIMIILYQLRNQIREVGLISKTIVSEDTESGTDPSNTFMEHGEASSTSRLGRIDMQGLTCKVPSGQDQLQDSSFNSPPDWWSNIKLPSGVRDIPLNHLVDIGQLGAGGFAWVHQVKFRDEVKDEYSDIVDEEFAVKIIFKEYIQIQDSMKAIMKEIEAMSKLDSEYIVKMLGASLVIKPSIALELVPEGSLEDLLNTEGYKSHQTSTLYKLKLILNIAKGIQYLHSKRIIHRDLKPPNILISNRREGMTKISDFGLAKIKQTSTMMTTKVVGTRHYMAPEIYDKYVNEKVDIWAFGVIIQQIFRGVKPWEGLDTNQILYRVSILKEAPDNGELPRDCPQDLCVLTKKCWEKANRRPSAENMVKQLQLIYEREAFSEQALDCSSKDTSKEIELICY